MSALKNERSARTPVFPRSSIIPRLNPSNFSNGKQSKFREIFVFVVVSLGWGGGGV